MHECGGRDAREGLGMVRQRVGLRLALRRSAPLYRRAAVSRTAGGRGLAGAAPPGRRAPVRVDFNVPEGDDTRIRAAVPTIQYLLDRGATVVLMSHLGRPKGVDPALSLRPVAKRLARLVGRPVMFIETSDLDVAASHAVPAGSIALLENTRFWPG